MGSRRELERARRLALMGDDAALERFHRLQDRRRSEICLARAAIALNTPEGWLLPKNNIWNVPDKDQSLEWRGSAQEEDPGLFDTSERRWTVPQGVRVTGVVMDQNGCIYGEDFMDTKISPKAWQDQKPVHGTVRIGYGLEARNYKASSGWEVFLTDKGKPVNVEVLKIRGAVRGNIFE